MKPTSFLCLVALVVLPLCGCYRKQMKRVELTADNERAAIAQAVEYLRARQKPNGAWGDIEVVKPYLWDYMGTTASFKTFQVAATALCCIALLEADELNFNTRDMARRGIGYLMNTRPCRRSDPTELYSLWAVNYTTQCLVRCLDAQWLDIPQDGLEAAIRLWMEQAARQQALDGGWTYYDFNAYTQHPSLDSMSFATAAFLVTFHEAMQHGLEYPAKLRNAAIGAVCHARRPDGFFNYGVQSELHPGTSFNGMKGSLARTQPCNLALYLYDAGVDADDLLHGIDAFFTQHHFLEIARGRPYPHEAWYGNAGYYYSFGHFYAAHVIAQLPAARRGDYWQKLAQQMIDDQHRDGSWWEYPRDFGFCNFYGTGMSLTALVMAYKARHLS